MLTTQYPMLTTNSNFLSLSARDTYTPRRKHRHTTCSRLGYFTYIYTSPNKRRHSYELLFSTPQLSFFINHLHHLTKTPLTATSTLSRRKAQLRDRERECRCLIVQQRENPACVGLRSISRTASAISAMISPSVLDSSAWFAGELQKSLRSSPTSRPSLAMEYLLLSSSLGLPGT